MQIPFAGRQSAAEWSEANTLHFKPSLISLVMRIAITLALLGLLISLALVGFFEFGLILSAVIVILLTTQPFWARYVARIQYARNKQLSQPLNGSISNECVTIRTPDASSELRWSIFKRVRQNQDLVLLYQNSRCFNYFPRSFFESEADWQAFQELVRAKLPQKRRRA